MNLDHFIESIIIKIALKIQLSRVCLYQSSLMLILLNLYFYLNLIFYTASLYSTNVIHSSCEFHYIMNFNIKILMLLRYILYFHGFINKFIIFHAIRI